MKKPISKNELISHLAKYLPHFETEKSEAKTSWRRDTESFIKQLHDFNQLLTEEQKKEFRTKFNVVYEEISETFSIDETEEFAKLFIEFGGQHNFIVLTNYGKQLLSAASSFRFDEIEHLVNLYPDIYKKMEK